MSRQYYESTHIYNHKEGKYEFIKLKRSSNTITFEITHNCIYNCPYCCNESKQIIEDNNSGYPELAKRFDKYLSLILNRYPYLVNGRVSITGGEPSLIGFQYMKPIFLEHSDITFQIFSNRHKIQDWIDAKLPNLRFVLHIIDYQHIDIKELKNYLDNPYVDRIAIIYQGYEIDSIDKVKRFLYSSISENTHKLSFILDHHEVRFSTYPQYTINDLRQICQIVPGEYFINCDNGTIRSCCSFYADEVNIEEEEELPYKFRAHCEKCYNPIDNFTIER